MIFTNLEKAIKKNYKKGTFCTVKTVRDANVKKAFRGLNIQKHVSYKGARLGIAYDNMAQTQDNRIGGIIPAENQGLKWGEWESYPLFIQHKGKRYLRLYAQKDKMDVRFTMDGKEVSKSEISDYLLASEKADREDLGNNLTLTIKTGSIVEIV